MIKYKSTGNRVGKRHQYGGGASPNGKLKYNMFTFPNLYAGKEGGMLHGYMGTVVHVYNGNMRDCIVCTVDGSTARQYTEHKKITASSLQS